jgi:hypothetical protein
MCLTDAAAHQQLELDVVRPRAVRRAPLEQAAQALLALRRERDAPLARDLAAVTLALCGELHAAQVRAGHLRAAESMLPYSHSICLVACDLAAAAFALQELHAAQVRVCYCAQKTIR